MDSQPVGITEPVPRALEVLLRRAVLEHGGAESRRVFPASLHAGIPGVASASFVGDATDGALDHSLRVDVVSALVRRVRRPGPPPLVWLARSGDLDVQDDDLAWSSAVRSAGAELGLALPMVVLNRRSWRDPRTGVGRSWQRLRVR